MTHTAVILAGGMGSRLRDVVSDLPKPMAPVNGEPFLSYLLRYLHHYEFRNVVFSVGHMADKIMAHYHDSFMDMSLSYAVEYTPMGTGGGLRLALQACPDHRVLVLNGDSFFDVDLKKFDGDLSGEKWKMALALRRTEDSSRYGTIVTSGDGSIQTFGEKTGTGEGMINGGVYLIDKDWFLSETPKDQNFSLEKDVLEKKAGTGTLKGTVYEGYFIDIGLPADYARAQDDFKRFKY